LPRRNEVLLNAVKGISDLIMSNGLSTLIRRCEKGYV
jgi:hypothetical protein